MIKIIDFINTNIETKEDALLHLNIEFKDYHCIQANREINKLVDDWQSDKIIVCDLLRKFQVATKGLDVIFKQFNFIQDKSLADISGKDVDLVMLLVCLKLADVVIYKPALSLETIMLYKNCFQKIECAENKYIVFVS